MELSGPNASSIGTASIALGAVFVVLAVGAIGGIAVAGGADQPDDAVAPAETYEGVVEADGGPVQVLVRFDEPEGIRGVAERQRAADRRQSAFRRWAEQRDGVTIERSFWISSSMLVSVDSSEVPLQSLLNRPYVTDAHENYEFELVAADGGAAPSAAEATAAGSGETTYGLEQINATSVWDRYGVYGEGQRVAVLDTGIEPSHEAIELYRDDENDSTYAGGWAEFDRYGNPVEGSTPHDLNYHGTHVSGTVAGDPPAGRPRIGVAPNASLLHAKVFQESGTSVATIMAGLEWSLEQNASVVSMSLGTSDPYANWNGSAIENARDHGVVVVVSSGNDGDGQASVPSTFWSTIAVGASAEDETIASFSSGRRISKDGWDTRRPAYWPETWFAPTISAPGDSVLSASAYGTDEYSTYGGTSMAAPHVAGSVALIQAATPVEHRPIDVREALIATAWKPDDWNATSAAHHDDERDSRYGYGIVDVAAAVEYLNENDDRLVVASTDVEDAPVIDDGATVSVTVENTHDDEREQSIAVYVDDDSNDDVPASVAYSTSQTVPPGEHTFEYVVGFDRMGEYDVRVNSLPSETVTVGIDTIGVGFDRPTDGGYTAADPSLTGQVPTSENATVANVSLSVDGSAYDATVSDGQWWAWPQLSAGPHGAEVIAEAGDGTRTSATLNFTVDTTPPVIEDVSMPERVLADASYRPTVTVDDTGSGVRSVTVDGNTRVDHGAEQLSPFATATNTSGDHTVPVTATDQVGNENATNVSLTVVHVLLDLDDLPSVTSATTLDVTGTVGTSGHETPPVNVTVDGASDGTTATEVEADGSFTLPTDLAEGRNTLAVTASDDGNNTDDAALTVVRDTKRPVVRLEAPASVGSDVDAVTVNGTVTDATSGVDRVEFSVGEERVSYTDGQFQIDVPLDYGTNDVTVRATDAAGNRGSASVTVERDEPPGGGLGLRPPSSGGGGASDGTGGDGEGDDSEADSRAALFQPTGTVSVSEHYGVTQSDLLEVLFPFELYTDDGGAAVGIATEHLVGAEVA